MRKHSVFDRFSLVAATAAVAAHANARAEGFRQRDLRFLMELFCNWIEGYSGGEAIFIQNTQVLRYLNELEQEGFVRLLRRGKRPLYRLTRTGLIELISRAVNSSTTAPGQFFFLHYFMSSYRPKIIELVKSEGKQFPYALEVELQGLLNCSELLDREIKNAERTLKELDERIIEGQKASQLTAEAIVKKVPHDEIVRKWEEQYPYALNSHKPLSELFREISPDIARWELETGNTRRVENIWKPARAMHLRYLETLRKLKSEQS